VFPGNTNDTKTFGSQIRKVVERFGGKEVTFVGDRGMIKSAQVRDLLGQEFHYVTAITKPRIETLLKRKVVQMSLFDQELAEMTDNKNGIRYVLRRNPMRSDEIRRSRENRLQAMIREVGNPNKCLGDHPRAKEEVALRKPNERCAKLKLSKWVSFSVCERKLLLTIDGDSMREESKLDGCYVLKTDLKKEIIDKETIHSRYKDLSLVEWAFGIGKTVELEMRPIHVRLSGRTRGHALVVMLAYGIVKELSVRWRDIDMTVNEGIQELGMLCMTEIHIKGKPGCNKIPEPRQSTKNLLDSARVRLPEVLPKREGDVATNKKLTDCRKMQKNQ
jgi:transposase